MNIGFFVWKMSVWSLWMILSLFRIKKFGKCIEFAGKQAMIRSSPCLWCRIYSIFKGEALTLANSNRFWIFSYEVVVWVERKLGSPWLLSVFPFGGFLSL